MVNTVSPPQVARDLPLCKVVLVPMLRVFLGWQPQCHAEREEAVTKATMVTRINRPQRFPRQTTALVNPSPELTTA